MEKSEIIKLLSELIKKNKPDISIEDLSREINIRNDLGIDSIQILEMIGQIEEQFDIEIPDRKLREIQTIDQIVAFIEENQ